MLLWNSVQEVQSQEVQSGSVEEEQQKKKQSEMRKEAKAKKAVNAKATKDALLKRRLEQAKQFEGYKVPKPSTNSGMCSQEELPYEDISEDRGKHAQQDKDYRSQFNKDKARHIHVYTLPASRTAVPNQARTKESQKRKKNRYN